MPDNENIADLLGSLDNEPTDAARLRALVSWDPVRLKTVGVDDPSLALRPHGGWTLTIATGREVYLQRWHQYAIYAGLLCGIPTGFERFVMAASNRAQALFPDCSERLVILEPTLRALPIEMARGRSDERPAILPPVCSIAEFVSSKPARDPAECYSSLVAVWFQDQFGLPVDTDILDQLRTLEWDQKASDWTP